MTGSGGKYNFGVDIRCDQFRVKTVDDKTVPYFPTFLGECAFRFEDGKWYTVQVGVVCDEILARVDYLHHAEPKLARIGGLLRQKRK